MRRAALAALVLATYAAAVAADSGYGEWQSGRGTHYGAPGAGAQGRVRRATSTALRPAAQGKGSCSRPPHAHHAPAPHAGDPWTIHAGVSSGSRGWGPQAGLWPRQLLRQLHARARARAHAYEEAVRQT